MYHVYIIPVVITLDEQEKIIKNFYINKDRMTINKNNGVRIKKAYDENDDISFDTLDEFNAKKRWSLIKSNIIDNPKFYQALTMQNRQKFNIRA